LRRKVKPLNLTSFTFDSFLREQRGDLNSASQLDLRDVGFITPSALVLLAVECRSRTVRTGSPVRLVLPEGDVLSYLLRAGLLSCLDGTIDPVPPVNRLQLMLSQLRHGSNPMLLELSVFRDASSIPALLETIWWALHHRLKYRKLEAFDFCIALSEICQNVVQHNDSKVSGFIAMQVYRSKGQRFLEMAVGDDGVGLRDSLSRNPSHQDIVSDLNAIRLALRQGISEFDDRTRGNGLPLLTHLIFKHAGSITVRSGRGKLYVRADQKKVSAWSVPSLTGVQAVMSLPTKGG